MNTNIKRKGINMRNDFDAEFVRELFDYDADAGILRWKYRKDVRSQCNSHYAGTVAGSINSYGYRIIKIKGRCYSAHRLVWFHVTGQWPVKEIDHINIIKDDNRFVNLREATRSQNVRNLPISSKNTSGFKGVSWRKKQGKFCAKIKTNGKNHHLGYFITPEDASTAYQDAAKRLHGEFARVR